MAYAQVGTVANIAMVGSNGATWSGNWIFHLYPTAAENTLRNNIYNSGVYITTYNEYSNPTYANVMVGEWGTISATFLSQFLTAVGTYVDIYNSKLGNSIKLRINCVRKDSMTGVTLQLIVYGYTITLTSNTIIVGGADEYGRVRNIVLNAFVDNDNGFAAITYGLCLTTNNIADIFGMWRGDSSVNNTIRQAMYALLMYGGGGGGGGNPYVDGGLNTDPAGGEDQNFDETSDTILEPTLPSNPATGSGFVTAYVPTLSEINDVADYLIDPNVLQALANTVLKLSDVVVGLSVFPFIITATGYKNIEINLCGIHLNTGVSSHYSDAQFVTLNMGSVDVKKYWDNCLDFDPFTGISLYLPYIGYVDLDTDEVMGKTIQVKYNVDIFTGCCLALVIVDGSVMYQFPGECSCQIPVTSVSFDSFLQSAIGLGIAAASGAEAVKGGQAMVDKATDNFMKASGRKQIFKAQEKMWEAEAGLDAIKTSAHEQLALAGVSAVMSAKGQYSHAGAMSSCAGILGTQKPFLIIKRPKQCMPEGYESIRGFPCNMKKTLGDLSGYTEVGDIHLNIPDATVEEIVECERFLKGGVFL